MSFVRSEKKKELSPTDGNCQERITRGPSGATIIKLLEMGAVNRRGWNHGTSDTKGNPLSALSVGKSLGRGKKPFPRLSYISLCNSAPKGSSDASPVFRNIQN